MFTRVALPPLWIADQVRNDGPGDVGVVLFTRVALPPCGYCLEASMTAGVGVVLFTRVALPPCGFPPTRE